MAMLIILALVNNTAAARLDGSHADQTPRSYQEA